MSVPTDRAELRVLRFLGRAQAVVEEANARGVVMLRHDDGAITVEYSVLRALARRGKITTAGDRIVLSASPGSPASASDGDGEIFRRQHGERWRTRMEIGDVFSEVTVNLAESPLAQLSRYRLRDGTPFLSGAEFDAGERLRLDYTRGKVMPRLGANWEASVAPGRRGADGGLASLTDAALAARQRVDRALGAVGPELAGVLVDVCCFLKGLELIERERGWPVRSAKVVLKTGLGVLGRHYSPPAPSRSQSHTLHWGSDDYRPELR